MMTLLQMTRHDRHILWTSKPKMAVPALFLAGAISLNLAGTAQAEDLFNYPETSLNGIVTAEVSQSVESCRKICETRSGCAGYDYSEKKSACRLFASVGGARGDVTFSAGTRNLVTGYKDPTNPPLLSRFERLRQTDQEGSMLLALGREAFEKDNKNIGLQAINLAMQRGNKEAKLEIATWYDPRSFASDRVDAVDANKAARAYFELAIEGHPKANQLLSALCQDGSNASSQNARSFESFLGSTYCEGSVNQ